MKTYSNRTHCPVCNKEWDLCECDDFLPMGTILEIDDELTMSAIDFES